MEPVSTLVGCNPSKRFSVRTEQTHPQLRDLLVCSASSNSLFTTPSVNCLNTYSDATTPVQTHSFDYTPSSLAYGCGLVAAVGSLGQVTIAPGDGLKRGSWMQSEHYISSDDNQPSINNSVTIAPPLPSYSEANPRLYVSSNAEVVKIFSIVGNIPDYIRSNKRRLHQRYKPLKTRNRPLAREDLEDSMDEFDDDEGQGRGEEEEDVEETGVHDTGGTCSLNPFRQLKFPTAINHTSVSPCGRLMCCVGDTSEVFIHSISADGSTYELLSTFTNGSSNEGSFTTDWHNNSIHLAVGSQDGHVYVYDIRFLPTKEQRDWNNQKQVAVIPSSRRGPSGAIRKVKYSTTSDLLAFSEHRSIVQVVDARTYDRTQTLEIPFPDSPPRSSSSRIAPLAIPRTMPRIRTLPIPRSLFRAPISPDMEPLLPHNAAGVPVPISSLLEMIGSFRPPGAGAGIGGARDEFTYRDLPATSTYHATSLNFPTEDSTREDILGLDFDLYSENLYVATNDVVLQYKVNVVGRRSFEGYSFS